MQACDAGMQVDRRHIHSNRESEDKKKKVPVRKRLRFTCSRRKTSSCSLLASSSNISEHTTAAALHSSRDHHHTLTYRKNPRREQKPNALHDTMAFFAAVRAHKAALAGGASLVGAGVGMVSPNPNPQTIFLFLENQKTCAPRRSLGRASWYRTYTSYIVATKASSSGAGQWVDFR